MRQVKYTDDKGRVQVVLIPDDAPDSHAMLGILVGPPSLEALGLPKEIETRLHNQLVARNLLTVADVKVRRIDVFAALQKALAVDINRVITCYTEGADT